MKSDHIVDFIDENGIDGIAPAEREWLEVHAAECAGCADALIAARFASSMLRTRCETIRIDSPPFFESRVLNAIRERRSRASVVFWSFRRWWQASYGLVGAMVLAAFFFGVLTILGPTDDAQIDASNYSLDSTEADDLSPRSMRDMTREQLIEVIYAERKDQGKR